jgi:uncharacterized protein YecT (DUF1311 family)
MLAVLLAAVAVQPPVIHEVFTPLPCPKKQVSTLDIEACTEQAILATDKKIDAQVAAIFKLLRADARAGFVKGEKAWLAYRKASCDAEASRYAGGTLAGVVAAGCTAQRNRTHLADLASTKKDITQ